MALAAPNLRMKALLVFLVATGCRIGEAVRLEWGDVQLDRAFCYVGRTKNGEPRGVHLPETAVAELANLTGREGRVFGWQHRWSVYGAWRVMADDAGMPWFTPHVARHTYATWMRRYAGLDELGLLATGAWKDRKSVQRYVHVDASEEAKKADLLPLSRPSTG